MGLFDWFKAKAKPAALEIPPPVAKVDPVLDPPDPPVVRKAKPQRELAVVEAEPEPLLPSRNQTGPKLPEEAQLAICELLGMFKKPPEIADYINREYKVKVSTQNISYYVHSQRWQGLINRHRQGYLAQVDLVPLKHKRVRLERMEAMYQQANGEISVTPGARRDKRRELLDILRQAKAEEAELANQQTNIVAISLQGLSDADLLKRVEELRVKVANLGGKLDATRSGIPQDGEVLEAPIDAQVVEAEGVEPRLAPQ